MTTLKQMAKSVAGEVLLCTGLWQRHLERMAWRNEAVVLTYHRVIEKWDRTLDYSQPGMVVTAETFERQLSFLREYFHIVPLSSLVNSKFDTRKSKCSDRPLCAITFDDGWRDNYEIAYPILQKHGVPATIFLTTDFIETDRIFWHTELMYLLMHADESRYRMVHYVLGAYPSPLRHLWKRLARSGEAPSAHAIDSLVETIKKTCGHDEIDRLIRDLGYALRASGPLVSDRHFFLDWDQVREMAGAGIEIGSHGCSHRILTRLSMGEAINEVERSKQLIEDKIGIPVRWFAFPNNKWDLSMCILIERAGYKAGFVGDGGAYHSQQRYAVPRLGAHEGMTGNVQGNQFSATLVFALAKSGNRGLFL